MLGAALGALLYRYVRAASPPKPDDKAPDS
jgi:hypothetical protein